MTVNRVQYWFPLPGNFHLDDEMVRLKPVAQLLLIRVIALCATQQTGGRVSGEQLRELARGMVAKPQRLVDELVDTGVLRADMGGTNSGQSRDKVGTDSGQGWDKVGTDSGQVQDKFRTSSGRTRDKNGVFCLDYVLSQSDKWLVDYAGGRGRTPAQRPAVIDEGEPAEPRARGAARAPVLKERKKERTTSRPASPDGRDVVARAAPRSAGGAARPAPLGPGMFAGPVREVPDFAARAPLAPDAEADNVLKAAARSKLDEFARSISVNASVTNSNSNGRANGNAPAVSGGESE